MTDKVTGETKTIKVRDGHAIQMANAKIEEIRQGFVDWLGRTPDTFKQQLSDRYNRLFNCFVRPNFDGTHQTFPDLDLRRLGIADLYKSQKDAVWMLKTNGGGICDHEVGAGKTLIMCTAAYEMKRLGLANKPMIIGLKANVFDIADTFRKAYPNAKVLYPGKNDFNKQNRQRIFNDIKNNDWDCIILTHEQFGMIPQALEIQEAIMQKELDSVEENLEVLRQQGRDISRGMLKGLEKRKQTLEAKLQNIQDSIAERKDDSVDFKMMGIDHLFVDESHQFKNLMFNTRHDRVSGLGNPDGSQRALNMLFAIRTIQERSGKDLGATFLSGTTISNSLTELYLLFKYLRPQALEIQEAIMQKELDSVEEKLEVLRQQGRDISRGMLKGLEKRKQTLEAKLQNIQDSIAERKDDAVDFKMMGIDHLFVDESHQFKNLMFNTRHDRVSGLGNPDGSQRALNMLFAIRTIQERSGKDLGATFLSGTTISNSLTELYLLFKYLRPQALEKQGINSFDAWAAVFAKKSTDYEFSITNDIIQKERFRTFIKVPELAAFYAEVWE